ncbi:MAG: hypothetical protein EOO99_00405 [Pedobacter sp.]|nr:MAG: hypothetical protein EOO99_00405 [Pedobacter sp.]
MLFYIVLSYCLCLYSKANAQSVPIKGFVIDKETKARLAKVYIYNPRISDGFYNNLKGEFTQEAKVGDTLFAALSGYALDTLIVKNQGTLVFQLKPLSIRLNPVDIYGKKPTPQEIYEQNIKDYKYKLALGNTKNLFTVGSGGVGLSIDAIYNLLSRQGKNARYLQQILEKDYKEAIIDHRFNPEYVKSILGHTNFDIKDFMLQYRPTYQFVLSASDYAFSLFVRNSYNSYKRNPSILRLPKLPNYKPLIPLGSQP